MTVTLTSLMIFVALVAAAITGLMAWLYRGKPNWILSYIQNFAGVFFIVSGGVKAVDPLGTAYKMEQYFAEFTSTFEPTWFSFLVPMFEWMAGISATVAFVMIVLEIVLGVTLIIGFWRKISSWLFFLIMVVFTFLTGFTHLTGYVPSGVNFFDFANWGEYVDTNRKVTDCGCFGDFLKLEPKTSFFKDLFLMIPAILFILFWKREHQLFSPRIRSFLALGALVITSIFCWSNYVWDIPSVDFRPFYEGQNVRETKAKEMEAAGNVQITHYKITDKSSGKVIEIPFAQYMKEFKKYPKEEFELDQIKSEPEIPSTKISDFDLSNAAGEDASEEILADANYNFWIVSYKIPSSSTKKSLTVPDTTWVMDTTLVDELEVIKPRVENIGEKTLTKEVYAFDQDIVDAYTNQIKPLVDGATADGFNSRIFTKIGDWGMMDDFRHTTQVAAPVYMGDDIMLKTIIRSNPGVMLVKDGTIIKKWHINKLPTYEKIKAKYMK